MIRFKRRGDSWENGQIQIFAEQWLMGLSPQKYVKDVSLILKKKLNTGLHSYTNTTIARNSTRVPMSLRRCLRIGWQVFHDVLRVFHDQYGFFFLGLNVHFDIFGRRNRVFHDQYGFFFLGLNVHFDIFGRRNGPSVTVRRIFEFVHCPINLSGISN